MAIIADKNYNLKDYAAAHDPSGKELAIAEVLTERNDILQDMPFVESNLDSGHEFAVRTGIPSGTWRRAYEGVDAEKATTKQVVARYGTIGSYSVVDKLVAEKGGNVDGIRAGQSKAIIAGMGNSVADALFYGGTNELNKLVGLSDYYNHLTTAKADTAKNVVNAGSNTANNTSIWLVVWSPELVYGFFPKGTVAGISRKDFGLVNHYDPNTQKEYPAYKEYFEWKPGLAVQDWRYAGRICNIKVADLANVDLYGLMQDLEESVEAVNLGKPVFYMNRKVRAALRKQIGNKTNVHYTPEQPGAKPIMHFDEIPVHICDRIRVNEALVGN